MDFVMHYDFKGRLQAVVADSTPGQLLIALRAGGEIDDSNIVIIRGQTRQEWRVGTRGGHSRIDSWNLVGVISSVVSKGILPGRILACYSAAISSRTGWVILTVNNGRATSAQLVSELS